MSIKGALESPNNFVFYIPVKSSLHPGNPGMLSFGYPIIAERSS
jgi:hypothetical protein